MIRDLNTLANNVYDVCVIGGGIHGAFIAWDAALRGLSVALVEKADFASATSSNSLKIVHGGFRYLQHADIVRMRQSLAERSNLMRIAPHLVHPMPVIVPTYGRRLESRPVLWSALALNDLIGFDRNKRSAPEKRIPRGRVLTRQEVMDLVPAVSERSLNGGALFYDARIEDTERLVISVLRAADDAGARMANYVEAVGFLREHDAVAGIEARDALTRRDFSIRAKMVVNAAGPWTDQVRNKLGVPGKPSNVPLAKAMNVVTRPLFNTYAVGLSSPAVGAGGAPSKGRFYFFAPWRGRTIAGTEYQPYHGDPSELRSTTADVEGLLRHLNMALPSAELTMDDVSFVHCGLVSLAEASPHGVKRATRSQVFDHRSEGVRGLISVTGVKYTTARHVAEKVVDLVFKARGSKPPRSRSAVTPVYGGEGGSYGEYVAAQAARCAGYLDEESVRHLVDTYGSAYLNVLSYADGQSAHALSPASVIAAQVRHAVREEMAQTLSDVVFRRTDLGSVGHPGRQVLELAAHAMSAEIGSDAPRMAREVEEVEARYPSAGAGRLQLAGA